MCRAFEVECDPAIARHMPHANDAGEAAPNGKSSIGTGPAATKIHSVPSDKSGW